MERIVVLVSKEEKSKIKRAAGLVPLSAWMKAAAMQLVAIHIDNEYRKDLERRKAKRT
jgi:hypothetical protein